MKISECEICYSFSLVTQAHADIAVVGAGPAGAWAAYLLARRGARILLFDPSHPREKPCGGGVTRRALAVIEEAVPARSLPAVRIDSVRLLAEGGRRSAVVPLTNGGLLAPLIVVSRRDFDSHLLLAARGAGAELVAARVTDVSRDGRGICIRTADGVTRTARWLVGADGANSLVRRRFSRPFRRNELSIATGFYAHGLTSKEIVIEIVHRPPGYIWSFPRPDHLAIGICAQADGGTGAAALQAQTAAWIGATGIGEGARLEPYSWPIPSFPAGDFDALTIAGPGWLLVGDAAGLADPVTREGIFFALESARHAAAAFGAGIDPEREYRMRVRDTIARELARAGRLKASFFQPRFTELLIDALLQSEGVRTVIADLIAGTQGYRGLAWRLARTMEVGLTWKFLRLRTEIQSSQLRAHS